jgi:excisionase family DNA binding protein
MIEVNVEELAEKLATRLLEKGIVQPPRRGLLTVKDVAERLGVTDRHVRKMLQDGELPSYKLGEMRRVEPDAVEAYLAAHRADGPDHD